VSALLGALALTLLWTNPITKSDYEIVPPSERATPADSLAPLCAGQQPLGAPLDSVIVYGYPLTGGGFRRIAAKSVQGKEGVLDSIVLSLPDPVWSQGGRFHITTKTTVSKESCPSNFVTKLPGQVTAVEVSVPSRVIVEEWFDIQGRRLKGPSGTGIRWVRWSVGGRFIGSQRVVVVRDRVMSPLRRPKP